ncbi:MAG: aminopeptidase P family protein [Gemmataceae bacterium]|nr:aminopeptidase P family protein [Gemmataceae bacterium]
MNPHAAAPQRRQSLRATLTVDGIDAFLVSAAANVTYLTGFTGEASYLIVGKKKDLLVSDARFTEQIAEECPDVEIVIRPPTGKTLDCVAEALRSLGAKSTGFESQAMTVSDFDYLKGLLPEVFWLATRDRVESQRIIKDSAEIMAIRQAISQAEQAFLTWKKWLRPECTEKQCADELERLLRLTGARGSAFPLIVAAGARAALPHAIPSEHSIGKAALLLVDWGANSLVGYKSDLTRVLDTHNYLGKGCGDIAKLREIHQVVCRAQQAAREVIRPGALASEVDAAARKVIAEAGYEKFFGHGLGHGFGLLIHEGPWLRPKSETPLQPGMVLTLEPGIYLPGVGGVRIEDDFLVIPDGVERLTSLPTSLEENQVA